MPVMKPYSKEQKTSFAVGFFAVLQLLERHPERLKTLYVAEDALESDGYRKVLALCDPRRVVVSSKAVEKISQKKNGHVMAEFEKWEDRLDAGRDHLVLVQPMDQGNLGNAMRSLLAFGLHDLALVRPCADPFDPKTVRASMGALFHIRVQAFDSFSAYREAYPREYYPFVLEESTPLSKARFSSPLALVFGNEATGLPREIFNENNVRIEQSDEVDSLNLTTSIAIALYQLSRQRG